MKSIFSRLVVTCILCVFSAAPSFPTAEEKKLGDVASGSRSVPVHLIDLYDPDGGKIWPDDQPLLPFSTKQTCLPCHDYDKIKSGWHFNATDSAVVAGRPGHPWILTDPASCTQIPLSYRNWPGVLRPDQVGMTYFAFTRLFGRQLPGGGAGEKGVEDPPDVYLRWLVSGDLEVNCLACHDMDPGHDQAEYAAQVMRENFRWATAASAQFAWVEGSAKDMPDNWDIYSGRGVDDSYAIPPRVHYKPNTFDLRGKVLLNIVRRVPNERCYFCHSDAYVASSGDIRWEGEEDVHLKAGLMCVDCHRNGLEHAIIRGYEGEAQETGRPVAAAFTCKGCHVGTDGSDTPRSGRFGAPKPQHGGIPTVHFERLTCTTCHSGPWPMRETYRIRTSMAHGLGVHGMPTSEEAMPIVLGPVFASQEDGKVAPHRAVYPAYWAFVDGDSIEPISPNIVRPIVLNVIAKDTLTDSTNVARILEGLPPELSDLQLTELFEAIQSLDSSRTVAYVAIGKLHFLDKDGTMTAVEHAAGQPYLWPLAHDVRPAAQSLGARGCSDCHSLNSPFYFGKLIAASPLDQSEKRSSSMRAFQGEGVVYPRLFAFLFLFRPYLKAFLVFSGVVIGLLLLVFLLRGVQSVLDHLANKQTQHR